MVFLKQSTAVTIPVGPFLDDTDGKTAETGLTITQPDIRLSKNGGDFAQRNAAGTLVHDENGYYALPLDGTDTNTVGRLRLTISESGALPVWEDFMILPAVVYNSLVLGTDNLVVNGANAIMSDTGITEGGTWTFEKLMKICAAWFAGKWQDKSGESGTYEVLDPDDGETVILEVTPSATTPQKTVVVLI